ncbi:MAG: cyclodeaminase/cyclohydrolase family protein [Anaerolineae bacterium]|nr:cyclodeaminase/cyclohydrolase family protein [Phycisphaerae bacterium]
MTIESSASIAQFLDATAAKQPAPGGGSVTALAGALAAAIGEMVLQYSIGRKDVLPADDTKLREALAEMTRARNMLVELMIEDQAAYSALSAARKNARDQGDADPTFAAALLACIRIPQAIGATAGALLDLCAQVAPKANKFLLSDLAVCAELAMATVRCATYNVQINLADVSDATERRHFEDSMNHLIARATERIRSIIPAIWKRLS